jgi:2-(1,2-epoxy-1,2-dihydrophenyl)acetyl-CoA isomerase
VTAVVEHATAEHVVRLERRDGVGTVTLDRPDRLNAMSSELLTQLLAALEQAVSDDSLRVLVLTGAGRAFCVGGDLQGFAAAGEGDDVSPASEAARLRHLMRASQLLRESRLVSVAAVNGACAGAGLSLALACDLRLASSSAVFRTAFIAAGLSGDFGGTWSLPRLLGEARAKELYLLNEKVRAEEALRLGLVSRVFPADDFAAQVGAVVTELAGRAPLALRGIKANLNDAAQVSFTEACDREVVRHVRCRQSPDSGEAARAFLERRAPVFGTSQAGDAAGRTEPGPA